MINLFQVEKLVEDHKLRMFLIDGLQYRVSFSAYSRKSITSSK